MKILLGALILSFAFQAHAFRVCKDLYRQESEVQLIAHLKLAQKFPLLFNEFDQVVTQLKSDFRSEAFTYVSSDGNPIIFKFKDSAGNLVVVDSAKAASHGEGVLLKFDIDNQKVFILDGRTWGGVKITEGGELLEVGHRF